MRSIPDTVRLVLKSPDCWVPCEFQIFEQTRSSSGLSSQMQNVNQLNKHVCHQCSQSRYRVWNEHVLVCTRARCLQTLHCITHQTSYRNWIRLYGKFLKLYGNPIRLYGNSIRYCMATLSDIVWQLYRIVRQLTLSDIAWPLYQILYGHSIRSDGNSIRYCTATLSDIVWQLYQILHSNSIRYCMATLSDRMAILSDSVQQLEMPQRFRMCVNVQLVC